MRIAQNWAVVEATLASETQRVADLTLRKFLACLPKAPPTGRGRLQRGDERAAGADPGRGPLVDGFATPTTPDAGDNCEDGDRPDRSPPSARGGEANSPPRPSLAGKTASPAGLAGLPAKVAGEGQAPATALSTYGQPSGPTWPGIVDPEGRRVLDEVRGHLQAAVEVIRREMLDPPRHRPRALRLWSAMNEYRTQISEILYRDNLDGLADCDRCDGQGFDRGAPCPDCCTTGVDLSDED